MAISDSVTVSIGEETSGDLREIFLVSADVRSCQPRHSGHPGHVWAAEGAGRGRMAGQKGDKRLVCPPRSEAGRRGTVLDEMIKFGLTEALLKKHTFFTFV